MAEYRKKWYDNEILLRIWYFDKKYSLHEMAERAGVSDETMRLLCLKYNIKKGEKHGSPFKRNWSTRSGK